MNQKKILLIFVIFLSICFILKGFLTFNHNKKAYDRNLELLYMDASYPFAMQKDTCYRDYSYVNEKNLIINLASYKDSNVDSGITLEEVKDFLSSEFDENGNPKILTPPDNISNYIFWYWHDDQRKDIIKNYEYVINDSLKTIYDTKSISISKVDTQTLLYTITITEKAAESIGSKSVVGSNNSDLLIAIDLYDDSIRYYITLSDNPTRTIEDLSPEELESIFSVIDQAIEATGAESVLSVDKDELLNSIKELM